MIMLHEGACHHTSTPQKSRNNMKGKKKNYYLVQGLMWVTDVMSDIPELYPAASKGVINVHKNA